MSDSAPDRFRTDPTQVDTETRDARLAPSDDPLNSQPGPAFSPSPSLLTKSPQYTACARRASVARWHQDAP